VNPAEELAELRRRANAWIAGDPDPTTRVELQRIVDHGDERELSERFVPLEFGTAGLRGLLGAGPGRMNRAVVIRTTYGLARHVLSEVPDAAMRGVIVGHDARTMSHELAEEVAAVLAAAGMVVHRFEELVPTPLVSFAVQHLGAAVGIMITASHNPGAYNGYKVYWSNGAQLLAPHDRGVAREIEAAPEANSVPREPTSARIRAVPRGVEEAYLAGVEKLAPTRSVRNALRIVYTPLHGVGHRLADSAMARAGFAKLIAVADQVVPDPSFPTVPFPNPEEPGALDHALALGRKEGADLVIAHDPDADRLAVAARNQDGELVQLTGNQLGALLGHYLLTEDPDAGPRAVISTIVSSPMLGVMARELGAHYEETLTGFKWIVARGLELEREGKRFVFGYEEAIGYTIGSLVRDKDGIGAGVVAAELAALEKQRGSTLWNRLDELYRRFGVFASLQRSVTVQGADGLARIAARMSDLRAHPLGRVDERRVVEWRDHAAQRVTLGDNTTRALGLPASDVLAYEIEGGSRLVIRPSGTEPKLKYYVDHRETVAAGESPQAAEARAKRVMEGLLEAVMLRA
jgi:phosphomannomutase